MFKKRKPTFIKPKEKSIYAWNSIYAGSFLVYVETLKDFYRFIFLPGPSDFFLTLEDFDKSIKSEILEFVEKLPDDVYNETLKFSLKCPSTSMNLIKNENDNQPSPLKNA